MLEEGSTPQPWCIEWGGTLWALTAVLGESFGTLDVRRQADASSACSSGLDVKDQVLDFGVSSPGLGNWEGLVNGRWADRWLPSFHSGWYWRNWK